VDEITLPVRTPVKAANIQELNLKYLKFIDSFIFEGKVVGKNTYEAIQSGLIFGHASMIDSMIERLLQELGTKPKIILTGGLSPIIQPALNLNAQYEENLTLVGLEEIFNLNN